MSIVVISKAQYGQHQPRCGAIVEQRWLHVRVERLGPPRLMGDRCYEFFRCTVAKRLRPVATLRMTGTLVRSSARLTG